MGSEGGWESKGTRMSVRRGDWKTYSENIKVRLRVSRGAIGVYGRDREEWNIVGKTLWVTKVSTQLVFFGSRLMEWGQEGETVLEMDQEAYIDAVLGAKYERTTFWSRLFGCRPDSSDRARSHTPFLMVSEAPPLICIALNRRWILQTHEHQLRIPSSSLFPSSPRRLCHLFSAFRSQSVEAGGFVVTRGWIDEAGHRIKVKAVWKFEDLLMGVQYVNPLRLSWNWTDVGRFVGKGGSLRILLLL